MCGVFLMKKKAILNSQNEVTTCCALNEYWCYLFEKSFLLTDGITVLTMTKLHACNVIPSIFN